MKHFRIIYLEREVFFWKRVVVGVRNAHRVVVIGIVSRETQVRLGGSMGLRRGL